MAWRVLPPEEMESEAPRAIVTPSDPTSGPHGRPSRPVGLVVRIALGVAAIVAVVWYVRSRSHEKPAAQSTETAAVASKGSAAPSEAGSGAGSGEGRVV